MHVCYNDLLSFWLKNKNVNNCLLIKVIAQIYIFKYNSQSSTRKILLMDFTLRIACTVSCNLAVFHFNTTQDSVNCFHLQCPNLESCIPRHRGNVILYNVTKGEKLHTKIYFGLRKYKTMMIFPFSFNDNCMPTLKAFNIKRPKFLFYARHLYIIWSQNRITECILIFWTFPQSTNLFD